MRCTFDDVVLTIPHLIHTHTYIPPPPPHHHHQQHHSAIRAAPENQKSATAKFQLLNEANITLKDLSKKIAYDQYLSTGGTGSYDASQDFVIPWDEGKDWKAKGKNAVLVITVSTCVYTAVIVSTLSSEYTAVIVSTLSSVLTIHSSTLSMRCYASKFHADMCCIDDATPSTRWLLVSCS